ncbi:MAG: pSer/pThr/pTyr-binding forkhead associated (FHA) protein [Myxococcota bacterium]|jgi:pSer/pThr/pTyr-binding forkhead associated (FHA) protein
MSATAYLFWRAPEGPLQRTEVPFKPTTIGSLEVCGLSLSPEAVGPIHASVERGPHGSRVRRLSRVRPVSVNGVNVQTGELASGDKIALGETELTYVDGPDIAPSMLRLMLKRDDKEIQVDLPVAGSVTVLGRMEGDILIDDDSVSSRHLEIENFGPGLRWVRDLGSTNGSEINGTPLGLDRQPLEDGDTVTAGRVRIVVRDAGAAPEGLTNVVQRTVIFVPDSAMA